MIPSPTKPTLSLPAMTATLRGERDLLGLREVLVRGAVAVERQRDPLAGRPAARRGAALDPVALDVVAARGLRGEPLPAEGQVAVHDAVHPALRGHREVDPDVVEERLGGPGEVVHVGGQPVDGGLARSQYLLVVARAALQRV